MIRKKSLLSSSVISDAFFDIIGGPGLTSIHFNKIKSPLLFAVIEIRYFDSSFISHSFTNLGYFHLLSSKFCNKQAEINRVAINEAAFYGMWFSAMLFDLSYGESKAFFSFVLSGTDHDQTALMQEGDRVVLSCNNEKPGIIIMGDRHSQICEFVNACPRTLIATS